MLLAAAFVRGDTAPAGQSFSFLQAGFTQALFGSTDRFAGRNGYLGGVVALPSGDVIAAECVMANTRLHRFSATATTTRYGTIVHPETILPSAGGCGLVPHPDGTLYLNMNDGTFGVANVNATTGALIRRMGPRGNALGIAVDPITNHLVYAASDCVAGTNQSSPTTCTLVDLNPVTGQSVNLAVFNAKTDIGYIDGLYFDPSGTFIFLDNRYPLERLTIVARTGSIVRHVAVTSEPAGIGFRATAPKFIVTNNTDGTMTRFDFPGDDYAAAPTITTFAGGGYRGDLMQAGPDGCLYVTQGGTRYDNYYEEDKENSVVRICDGFMPPAGVPLTRGTLSGVVTDATTSQPIAGATVQISTFLSTTTDSSGRYIFNQLIPGTYTATASATNFASQTAPGLIVVGQATTTHDFALTPTPVTPVPGTLQGMVTDAATAKPIVSATVALSNAISVATDANGRYAFTLTPGTYDATVTAANYNGATAAGIVIATSVTTTRNFALTPMPGTLKGIVTDAATAKPIASASVLVSNGPSTVTDATGRYTFTLPPGSYDATASAVGYSAVSATALAVTSNNATTRNFALAPLTADVAITATAPSIATAGTAVTYAFTVTNRGVAAANNTVVTHIMPAQTVFMSVTAPAGWTCAKPATGGNGTVSCANASMPVNEIAAISVNVMIVCPFAAATLTLSATATTSTPDSNTNNNAASIVTTVVSPVPTISGVSVDNPFLWPPNHRMQDVQVNYVVTSVPCPTTKTTLSIASNEPIASGDIEIVDAHHVRLRSDRAGSGSGRIYTITITATNDKAVATKAVAVTVTHDQGK